MEVIKTNERETAKQKRTQCSTTSSISKVSLFRIRRSTEFTDVCSSLYAAQLHEWSPTLDDFQGLDSQTETLVSISIDDCLKQELK